MRPKVPRGRRSPGTQAGSTLGPTETGGGLTDLLRREMTRRQPAAPALRFDEVQFRADPFVVDDPTGNLSTGLVPCVPEGATGTWIVGGYIEVGEGEGWSASLSWIVADPSHAAFSIDDRRLTTTPTEDITITGPLRVPITAVVLNPTEAYVAALLAFDDVPTVQPILTMYRYGVRVA